MERITTTIPLAVDVRLRDGGGSPFHVVLPEWIFGPPFRAYSPKGAAGRAVVAFYCSIFSVRAQERGRLPPGKISDESQAPPGF